MNKESIPIFFATDDNYIPFLGVAICSLIENASKEYNYKILILNSGLKKENIQKISKFATNNVQIEFVNVDEKVKDIADDLSFRLRDYYSNSIYYRIFIPSLYKEYDKALYLDSDIVVVDDISKLYFEELQDNLLGAITDEVVNNNDTFCEYATKVIGIDADKYFNSGILVMNLEKLREEKIELKFVYLLGKYNFDVIAPDQDYLNYLCRGKVKYIHKGWDKMALITDEKFNEKDLHLIHYNMFQKPWKYSNIPYENHFWSYAQKTCFYDEILDMKNNHTEEMSEEDKVAGIKLENRAARIIEEANTFENALDSNYFENLI